MMEKNAIKRITSLFVIWMLASIVLSAMATNSSYQDAIKRAEAVIAEHTGQNSAKTNDNSTSTDSDSEYAPYIAFFEREKQYSSMMETVCRSRIKDYLKTELSSFDFYLQMAAFSGQQGRNTRPVRAIIGGQEAA